VNLKYRSGVEVSRGDQVLFHGEAAVVEFVVVDSSDAATEWFFQEYGGGVMIVDPKVSGHTFIPAGHLDEYEDLEFVARAAERRQTLL
jgi:hypothetical protein